MVIVWDEPKRVANLAKHGLDFAALDIEFFAAATIRPAKGGRLAAFGLLAGERIAVVFAALGDEAVSIVSMRPASRKERTLYA
jgi:uncharacterized DUF497 family protein